jgi:hypothetical protein
MFLLRIGVLSVLSLVILQCGDAGTQEKLPVATSQNVDSYQEIKSAILTLRGQISGLLQSDFATCSAAIVDPLVKNICEIAQASTNEAMNEQKGELSAALKSMLSSLTGTQDDVKVFEAQWVKLYGVPFPKTTGAAVPTMSDCENNTAAASVIECMKVNAATIGALAAIVNDVMLAVDVGTENLLAGPNYETLMRLATKSRINAFVDGLGSVLTVGADPLTSTNLSATVDIHAVAHGYNTGDKVQVSGCASGNGLTAQELYGIYEVTVSGVDDFSVDVTAAASASGTLGGAGCIVRSYTGAGMDTIWSTGDGSDAAVRVATGGTKNYNFAICEDGSADGYVCYDKTNAAATFATISGGWAACAGSGNIVCK